MRFSLSYVFNDLRSLKTATRPCVAALLLTLLLGYAIAARAGEITVAEVSRTGNDYRVVVEMRIAAHPQAVYVLLTDYAGWPRLNPSVVESRVIYSRDAHRHRVYTRLNACVWFFCVRLIQVQDIVEHPMQGLDVTVVSQMSDFERGYARWRLKAAGDSTRARFEAEVTPAFWVPPLIGPWIIKHKLQQEAIESIANVERLAAERR